MYRRVQARAIGVRALFVLPPLTALVTNSERLWSHLVTSSGYTLTARLVTNPRAEAPRRLHCIGHCHIVIYRWAVPRLAVASFYRCFDPLCSTVQGGASAGCRLRRKTLWASGLQEVAAAGEHLAFDRLEGLSCTWTKLTGARA